MKKWKVLTLLVFAALKLQATDMPIVVASYDDNVTTGKAIVKPLFTSDRYALYRLTGLVTVVVPGSAGTLCFNVIWTDGDTGLPINNGPACTPLTQQGYGPNWVYTFYAQRNSDISVQVVLNGASGSPVYNPHFRLEQF
jgi:hypothetical protein